ncbi:flagellar hook-length control protein FliK [Variovorax arabinosiphilus]|uniref:flagellar hook-length control protein FliK n=1 Tax=Variovorax arabinosiphilus TaxID=3053498 RepID=UPI002578CA6D|nr:MULTISPECIES: flagellar hook-length control protein FliK [unclassified Variovorax]MDM0118185.1 flagellar hook-length control protein FliK [Variovorax sp. J2L1-78]MDM0128610.1 flagellar hook-length control protein FliK [Variovorax sp. J2L1-63]MDM0233604.1 flagellar hook-length control protein FliK [Variovorax sp. J2R1-6]
MTGLVRLLDTLLTAKVSPPLDAGAVDPNAPIKAPGAASAVQGVVNDVRLLSNAALDRQLGGVDSASTRGAGLGTTAGAGLPASAVARLSFAARIISAVLADLEVDVGPVRGQGPVWAPRQQPAGPVLAGSLAHAVSNSGLFYESHLAQFAQGHRTLAQMAQEPQAAWPAPGVAAGGRGATTLQAVMAVVAGAGDASTPAAPGKADPAQPAVASPAVAAATVAAVAQAAPSGLAAARIEAPATPTGPSAAAASAPSEPASAEATPDALKMQAAYRWGDSAQTAAAAAERAAMRSVEKKAGDSDQTVVARAAATPPSGGEVVHPQLVTTVHQQLDLLATAAFRWTGEAWPGVAMDWRIEEEGERHANGEESPDDAPRRWSTNVSLQLPHLGTVDVRLSVAGGDVRATVVSSSERSRALLAGDGRTLAARFDAADLRLEQFQVAQGAVA